MCNESRSMGETAAKSDYMIKLITENEALRKKVQEIETKSRTCFHGKSVLIQSQVWSLRLRISYMSLYTLVRHPILDCRM